MAAPVLSWWSDEAGNVDPSQRYFVDQTVSGGERWLLIAGAMDPPGPVGAVSRDKLSGGERSGSFLDGVSKDMNGMQAKLRKGGNFQLSDFLMDMKLTRKGAMDRIKDFLSSCKDSAQTPVIYYTGHGQRGTGNWCFSDEPLSFADLKGLKPEGVPWPWLVIDCCFAGHWANLARNLGGPKVLAASPYFMTALDNGADAGGNFTQWIIGNITDPTRPIVYSGFSAKEKPFPAIKTRKYPYCSRVAGELFDSRIVMTQDFDQQNNTCAMVFGSVPGYPLQASKAATRQTYEEMKEFWQTAWKDDYRILYLSRGKTHYGIFMMKGIAKMQATQHGSTEDVKKWCDGKWNDGYVITSVCPGHSHKWTIVMSQCVNHYLYGDYDKGSQQQQRWRTRSSWNEIKEQIADGYNNGFIITAMEHSQGTYLLVMSKSTKGQSYVWGDKDGHFPCMKGLWEEGKDITVMFKDPTDGRWLAVATAGIGAQSVGYRTEIAVP